MKNQPTLLKKTNKKQTAETSLNWLAGFSLSSSLVLAGQQAGFRFTSNLFSHLNKPPIFA